ncbi:MAG: tRNA (adenosine(37)-N6)-threonylcarbamoyltransferase complex dimerization subunit type 1 TsaB [Candidatus Aureabacteria bacterium]|nr:tRNA (adenosine(37)-N6)-threonylcarbamoyltransferase complex dimerization subunit type 1 TsaB [Candidatus Auribacterota bacterium]
MIRLAISTSCSDNSVSVLLSDEQTDSLSYSRDASYPREQLVLKIAELLQKNQVDKRHITEIGVDEGPGSFTGIRTGVATANAFALGLNIAVHGFSSLDLIAEQYRLSHPLFQDRLCVALDAGRNQVYFAAYYVHPTHIEKILSDVLLESVLLAGKTGTDPLAGLKLDHLRLPYTPFQPNALCCLHLMKNPYFKNQVKKYAVPNYIRASDAEIFFSKKIIDQSGQSD